ncbi:3-ketoacyl-ACP reductase (plasmid) [Pseudonocardia sp. EC080610-09]|uniref:mycofactocin-coupled SDR family oxidoreductase n=1 Tax=unclassified Pseudonocardia TaxID=2619320 RepID=UPI0007064765|nr:MULTISPECIES: mycofactocin-coupled SDR family oxidoreductase [unclassified Pseudonocardia]ALL79246.1 3-ketoacyl-ACP reductase [Pseudonocardia sp. EC080610-09]ALL79779.1 3-ketoacyl-ACP reductase [Pseudonocardia sp. EC080610-09]ALL85216.1 3-ketoacyl-ACP reductase [Pseudonocardia sp. EC080619-01]
MTGKFTGKVVLVTGAARGQGRAEALRFAEQGASLILIDIADDHGIDGLPYTLATKAEFDESVAACKALDAPVHAVVADTRDLPALECAVQAGVAQLGGLDIVVANAGVYSVGRIAVAGDNGVEVLSAQSWQDMLDVNLTGVYHTVRATAPIMVEQGRGGAIVLTSSGAGLRGSANIGHYVAAKHGVVGLMKTLANELGPHGIRVNTVNPGQVDTPMIQHETNYRLFRPDLAEPTAEDYRQASIPMNKMQVPWVEPIDVANAVAFLASDEARYITGVALPVDAGTVA